MCFLDVFGDMSSLVRLPSRDSPPQNTHWRSYSAVRCPNAIIEHCSCAMRHQCCWCTRNSGQPLPWLRDLLRELRKYERALTENTFSLWRAKPRKTHCDWRLQTMAFCAPKFCLYLAFEVEFSKLRKYLRSTYLSTRISWECSILNFFSFLGKFIRLVNSCFSS